LGGEKLKSCASVSYNAAYKAAFLFFIFFLTTGIQFLSAQEQGQEQDQGAAESQAVSEGAGSEGGVRDAHEEAERAITLGDVPAAEAPGRAASIGLIVRMLLVLIVIALAVYGVIYFMKKSSRPPAQNDPYLKVLSTVHLGSNRYVHVISIGDKAWLVGSGDAGVTLITEITDQNAISAMLIEETRKKAENQSRLPDFKALLHRLGVKTSANPPSADDIRRRREKFRGFR
jgi:flagellar protein FliO/FliZ